MSRALVNTLMNFQFQYKVGNFLIEGFCSLPLGVKVWKLYGTENHNAGFFFGYE